MEKTKNKERDEMEMAASGQYCDNLDMELHFKTSELSFVTRTAGGEELSGV